MAWETDAMAADRSALLIVDMISDWTFEDAERLVEPALRAAPVIRGLKRHWHDAGLPVIYANDNHGKWRSDFAALVERSKAAGGMASQITDLVQPGPDDYFVLKPRHSAFHATPLEILLDHLEVRRLVITGSTTDQCVYMTAADARMRGLDVWIPRDAVISLSGRRNAIALEQIEHALQYETASATETSLLSRFLRRTAD